MHKCQHSIPIKVKRHKKVQHFYHPDFPHVQRQQKIVLTSDNAAENIRKSVTLWLGNRARSVVYLYGVLSRLHSE
jgi:hypothetical protein